MQLLRPLFLTMTTLLRFCRLATGFMKMPTTTTSVRRTAPMIFLASYQPVSSVSSKQNDAQEHEHDDDANNNNTILDPLVVCGPSGVGKGTIIAKYMEEMGGSERFGFTVSHTTRAPREGEEHGIHYHFCPLESMTQNIKDGAFLEYAEVHGNFYGTSWSSLRDVQNGGKRCLLDIDVQGVQTIKRQESELLQPKYIFISPPSLKELEERLIGRGTESAESLARRTANAREEMEYGMEEDNFDAIVVNQNLEYAVRDFAHAIKKLYQL
jgi:guanylate kinase